jgi:hypothetical protein
MLTTPTQIVIPPALFGQKDERSIDCFPMVTYQNVSAPWSIHRLDLDRLPVLLTTRADRLYWINPHVSLAFSDEEGRARKTRKMRAITHVKESIHCIFTRVAGLQDFEKTNLFGLSRKSQGGIDTLLFFTDLRLDVANHTIVADAFVLPLHDDFLPKIRIALAKVGPTLCQVIVTHEEHIVWKVMLPSLVERCRTWEHRADCSYAVRGAVPLSTEHGKVPICDYGRGKVTDSFRRRKEWLPFLPYVTRVAVSPLFSVSYLESVGGKLKDAAAFGEFDSLKDTSAGASSTISSTQVRTNCTGCKYLLPAGKLLVCSRCKQAVYCGRECQTKDWKKHKVSCEKV